MAQSVEEVIVDGVVLPSSAYTLYDGLTLVRTDGEEWPFCQDWAATEGPGVFSVTAVFGAPVPALGTLAMGEVVPEMLKACSGSGECKLPTGVVQSINRNGVSKVYVDPVKMIELGLRGLPLTDQLIATFNPNKLLSGPSIVNPDTILEFRRPGGVS